MTGSTPIESMHAKRIHEEFPGAAARWMRAEQVPRLMDSIRPSHPLTKYGKALHGTQQPAPRAMTRLRWYRGFVAMRVVWPCCSHARSTHSAEWPGGSRIHDASWTVACRLRGVVEHLPQARRRQAVGRGSPGPRPGAARPAGGTLGTGVRHVAEVLRWLEAPARWQLPRREHLGSLPVALAAGKPRTGIALVDRPDRLVARPVDPWPAAGVVERRSSRLAAVPMPRPAGLCDRCPEADGKRDSGDRDRSEAHGGRIGRSPGARFRGSDDDGTVARSLPRL